MISGRHKEVINNT